MPNWVYTSLVCEGSKEDLDELQKFMKTEDKEWDEEQLIPYPQLYRDMDKEYHELGEVCWKKEDGEWTPEVKAYMEKYRQKDHPKDGYNSGGYDWCRVHWGTKWGYCDDKVERVDDGHLNVYYETAWSYPLPLMEMLTSRFPSIKFIYHIEEEMQNFDPFETTLLAGHEVFYKEYPYVEPKEDEDA